MEYNRKAIYAQIIRFNSILNVIEIGNRKLVAQKVGTQVMNSPYFVVTTNKSQKGFCYRLIAAFDHPNPVKLEKIWKEQKKERSCLKRAL